MFERICLLLLFFICLLAWLVGCNIQGLDSNSVGLFPLIGLLGFVGIVVALAGYTKMEIWNEEKED